MRSYIKDFFTEFDYPKDSVKNLLDAYDTVISNQKANEIFQKCIDTYEASYKCNFKEILSGCEKAAEISGVHEYTVKLLLYVILSKQLKKYYTDNNISLDILHSTLLDLKYKFIECKLIKKIDGIFVAEWESGFFALTRFGLGRLQFEIIPFKYDSYEKDGKKISQGDPVINVHIPRSETPLDRESCLASYAQAKEFFKKEFTNVPVAFVCHSWLLFVENRKLLSDKSNIMKFMNDYDIIDTDYAEEGNYNQMWRLYDMDYTGNLDDFPENTSLRRAYKTYLKNGGRQGASFGIFFS